MSWRPGLPVVTDSDHAEWMVWRKTRKLEQQRQRRRRCPRIDYYAGPEALEVIQSLAGSFPGGDYSSVIDRLVLEAASGFRNKQDTFSNHPRCTL
jgi:hypothetical protein